MLYENKNNPVYRIVNPDFEYPGIFSKYDRSGPSGLTSFGCQFVIEGGENYIMAYLTAVANGHATMILKMAAGIDEHPFPDIDILSVIGIEWRKYTERGRYFIS